MRQTQTQFSILSSILYPHYYNPNISTPIQCALGSHHHHDRVIGVFLSGKSASEILRTIHLSTSLPSIYFDFSAKLRRIMPTYFISPNSLLLQQQQQQPHVENILPYIYHDKTKTTQLSFLMHISTCYYYIFFIEVG